MLKYLMERAVPIVAWFIYVMYFISACAFIMTESRSIVDWVGTGTYKAWALLMLVGAAFAVIGSIAKVAYVEVLGTLPLAFAAFFYAIALNHSAPYGDEVLGVAASSLMMATVGWLVLRFLVLWSSFGRTSKKGS